MDEQSTPWTAGRLREALAKYPDDTPLRVSVYDQSHPDGFPSQNHVVTDAAGSVHEYHPDGNITLTDFVVIFSSPIDGEQSDDDEG